MAHLRSTERTVTRAAAEQVAREWVEAWGWGYSGSATVEAAGPSGFVVHLSRFSSCD